MTQCGLYFSSQWNLHRETLRGGMICESGRTKDSHFWHLPLPTGCRANRRLKILLVWVLCVISERLMLVQSCPLVVPSLFFSSCPKLKIDMTEIFRFYSLRISLCFFIGCKVRIETCSIIFWSFKIESFSRMVSSFSHENPSWLSIWNLTKWIIGLFSQRRLSTWY